MKYKSVSLNIIFTLLFLIMSALFLIYIFRNIQNKECFTEGSVYSWKDGEDNTCTGSLYTNSELENKNSNFVTKNYNRFDNNRFYKKDSLRDPSHPYRNYCDVMAFDELLAYKCLNKSPKELHTIFESSAVDIASTIGYVYIYDDTALKSYILSIIQAAKAKLGTKVVGPVYVCVSQAPYLRTVDSTSGGNQLSTWNSASVATTSQQIPYHYSNTNAAGTITNTQSTSLSADTAEFDGTAIISSLYCHILIVYPAYNKKMVLKENTITKQPAVIVKFLEKTMANYYSDHGLCFIKCNKSTTLNCGCLTRTEAVSTASPEATLNPFFDNVNAEDITRATTIKAARDKPLYKSSCTDHTKNNEESNFTMMYYVNPYSNEYGDKGVIKDPEEGFPDEKCNS